MKSKYLALFMAGIVCLSGLTACSGAKQTTDSNDTAEETTVETTTSETATDKDYIEATLNLANNENQIGIPICIILLLVQAILT
jgi:maltose-binding protein MalE